MANRPTWEPEIALSLHNLSSAKSDVRPVTTPTTEAPHFDLDERGARALRQPLQDAIGARAHGKRRMTHQAANFRVHASRTWWCANIWSEKER